MLRIHQMSDLHLEFNNKFRPINSGGADILMLNGDICVADYFTKSEQSHKKATADHFRDFFKCALDQYEYVLYIPGNHEHYHGLFTDTVKILKEALPGVIILDNDSINISGYTFLGCTLWTDCDSANPLVLNYLGSYLNDFKIVKASKEPYRKFLPLDSVREHRNSLTFLDEAISEALDNVVVMTHHAPSKKSVHPSYDSMMYYVSNFGYYTELRDFIISRPKIKLWTHGHTHNNFDYTLGGTRIICNPMGYRDENAQGFNRQLYIDLP